MTLEVGTRLGIFEITGQIGVGGMGEVYRATDTKLGRDVAIKTLRSALAEDSDWLARFEREAKLLAALNHAHIASVYELDEHDGTLYIAMELVEGQTLEDELKTDALPIEEALRLGLQIALALEAAHDKGVVHRDLKPANIMITPDGVVKILDFGLAKAFSDDPDEASPLHSPALSAAMTQRGLILGTAGYMSPEQASGQAADQRADVWAFAVVLYEMLTGLPLFSGETVPHVLADILNKEPDWSRLPNNLHPRILQLLERSLVKKPRNRYKGIADARVDIESVLNDPAGPTPVRASAGWESRSRVSRVASSTVFVLLGAAVAALTFWLVWTVDEPPVGRRYVYPIPSEHRFEDQAYGRSVAISPNGRHVVYMTPLGLYLYSDDRFEPQLLVSADEVESPTSPFFSPDSQQVGFQSRSGIQRVKIEGGAPIPLGYLDETDYIGGASWVTDETIIVATSEGIVRLPVEGARDLERLLSANPGESFRSPQMLPSMNAILFVAVSDGDSHIEIGLLESGDRIGLDLRGTEPRYVETGHLIYVVDENLFAIRFDAEKFETIGQAEAVGLEISRAYRVGRQLHAHIDISDQGKLAFIPPFKPPRAQLRWFSRDGSPLEPVAEPMTGILNVNLSPNDDRVLFGQIDYATSGQHIWNIDIARGDVVSRLVDGWDGVWWNDGDSVAFVRAGEGLIKSISVRGEVEQDLFQRAPSQPSTHWLDDVHPNGKQLLAHRTVANGMEALLITIGEPDGESEVEIFDFAPALDEARFSPDGRWIAYNKREQRRQRHELFVVPNPPAGNRPEQVSLAGGVQPVWSADGNELYFLAPDGMLMVVEFDTETGPVGRPTQLFQTKLSAVESDFEQYAVSKGGQFLIPEALPSLDSDRPRIYLIESFLAELEELIPSN